MPYRTDYRVIRSQVSGDSIDSNFKFLLELPKGSIPFKAAWEENCMAIWAAAPCLAYGAKARVEYPMYAIPGHVLRPVHASAPGLQYIGTVVIPWGAPIDNPASYHDWHVFYDQLDDDASMRKVLNAITRS